mmetsp:Transcript_9561/g.14028  ORF Transcript_9561/g.14028 Transcript_9561/m.14028 type:complete len:316 (-) Transcript_9561:251-1198(-)|eukprot:CAMPEP_0194046448 /NCGR_PEP_ID=MMETSP0009_2-20130614/21114_1 /TAXON_ID=210454 /ORGANISM="Grammatophora oceanica, Strain CCMP 410" /LENGTH=315 /DNA_ID=CAMNT_0038691741 /DNA_START=71 /DNA_END=1018 /DNA_ORIENTATION=+
MTSTINNNEQMSTSTMKIPNVETLYFTNRQQEQCENSSFSQLSNLPAELLHMCLVEYSDWGELAKISNVQSSWSTLLRDAAEKEGKWELAEAMLHGTNGMATNPAGALTLYRELAGDIVVSENEEDGSIKIVTNNDTTTSLSAPAMKRISQCYLEGMGVETDTAEGVRWLSAAHEHASDIEAAHDLALIYEYGKHDVEIDVYRAADYFLKAAEGGHVEAMAEYAMCCELGAGTDQDDTAALDWYMKAANAGHVTAKYSVAEIFEEARGVPQSDSEACLWYYRAAVCGDEDSKKALRRLYDVARIVIPGLATILED